MDGSQRFSRRTFVAWVGGASAGYYLFRRLPGTSAPVALAQIPGGTLNPEAVTKYAEPLIIPPAMPQATKPHNVDRPGVDVDYYEIGVRQFEQQILPSQDPWPATTVWSYGSAGAPGTVFDGGSFHYPAFTIEATHGQPVRVKWINDLVDSAGNYLPHLLPVDQTLHWANPPGGPQGRDEHGTDQDPYTGPVPIVTHLHGGHATQQSDGYPEAWYLPKAKDIPGGFARVGSFYQTFRAEAQAALGQAWTPGSAVFEYDNDQRASTLWYHDHTLGMTRNNVYAGPAGFYLLRGGPGDAVEGTLPGPAPALGDLPGTKYYEIPLAIQDRSFNADGSLFYPDNRAFFEGLNQPPDPPYLDIPFIPEQACGGPSDVAPIWNPEFFGNTMVVNGRTWPYLEVEKRRYRFRLLNGCNSRFLILDFGQIPGVEVWQIGNEGGFLPAPVNLTADNGNRLLMGLAERADVIVDFTNVPVGNYVLGNVGPDDPFGGGEPGVDFEPADPETTGQVMSFQVVPVPASASDSSTPPKDLVLPKIDPLGTATHTRQVSLNEEVSKTVFVTTDADGNIVKDCASDEPFGPAEADLGTLTSDGTGQPSGFPVPLGWDEPITENPAVGATEVWEMYNFTADAHPIHIHEIAFEVVNRQGLKKTEDGEVVQPIKLVGDPTPAEPWESGFKDTVIAYPGQVTRVKAFFDRPGLFVWHCHILEHEDNEMMRPYLIGPAPSSGAFVAPPVSAQRATRRRRRRKRRRRRRARGPMYRAGWSGPES